MFNPFTRRVLIIVVTLALLTVSTAALAHGHLDTKSSDESHCAMCLAVHSATHLVGTAIVSLHFTIIQTAVVVRPELSTLAFVESLSNQDRAPPQL